MSVLIDGIMLPKNENIYITLMPGGSVVTTEKYSYYGRPKVKEIPEHHGRLIDADLLGKILKRGAEDEWNKNTAPFSWSYAYECLIDTLDSMPTIIEAEE